MSEIPLTYRALDHVFTIAEGSSRLHRLLRDMFAPLADPGSDCVVPIQYSLVEDGALTSVLVQGRLIVRTTSAERAIDRVSAEVNSRAVGSASPSHVVLHAAAVTNEEFSLLLPGLSGAGKSTLVAMLVRSGWEYLTDEAVAIERTSLTVRPYPKSISLSQASLRVLSDDGFRIALSSRMVRGRKVYVDPRKLGSVADSAGSRALIIFPFRQVNGGLRMARMRSAPAVAELARNAFAESLRDQQSLRTVADLVANGDGAYALHYEHGRDAATLVRRLVESLRSDRSGTT